MGEAGASGMVEEEGVSFRALNKRQDRRWALSVKGSQGKDLVGMWLHLIFTFESSPGLPWRMAIRRTGGRGRPPMPQAPEGRVFLPRLGICNTSIGPSAEQGLVFPSMKRGFDLELFPHPPLQAASSALFSAYLTLRWQHMPPRPSKPYHPRPQISGLPQLHSPQLPPPSNVKGSV